MEIQVNLFIQVRILLIFRTEDHFCDIERPEFKIFVGMFLASRLHMSCLAAEEVEMIDYLPNIVIRRLDQAIEILRRYFDIFFEA